MMKLLSIISIVLIFLMFGLYFFYKKNYITFELVCSIPDQTTFRPDAYVFFHSEKELNSFFDYNENTKKYKEYLLKTQKDKFNFSKYSYCIFYGKKIASMYYSFKTTLFNDKTPPYQRDNKIPVFVCYKLSENNSYAYIYRIERNINFRGFLGE